MHRHKQLFIIPFLTFTFLLLTCSYADYADGDGSAEFPYQIAEPNQLIYMSEHPEDWGQHFILTADINLALADPNIFTTALIAPDTFISSEFQGTPFTGTFDGNSHIIGNLRINASDHDYLGLFGRVGSSATILNLNLDNVSITGRYFLGGLCGENNGDINICYTIGSVTGRVHIGGLCGINEEGSISNCYATGSVTGGYHSGSLGGLCGSSYYNSSSINNCYSTGLVTGGIGSSSLGGLCGFNPGSINYCYFLDSSGPDNGAGEPLDDPNMKIQAIFVGWDFVGDSNGSEDHWQLCIDGYDYPRLTWQFDSPADFLHPGRVDHYDLMVLAHDWLHLDSRCGDIGPGGGDGIVNLHDYIEFSRYWLFETEP